MRYMRLYWYFFLQKIKSLWQYRVDFLVGCFSVVFGQLIGLLVINVAFVNIPDMYGWQKYEVGLMYGFAIVSRGIAHIFFDNLWKLGDRYIRQGELVRVLIRPINPLVHVMADRIQLDGIGTLISGVALTVYAITHLDITITGILILKFLYYAILGSLIYFGVNLFTATLSFWIVDSVPLTYAVFNCGELTRYPLDILSGGFRKIFTFLIPFAFTSYFPIVDILGKSQSFLSGNIMLNTLIIVVCLLTVSYSVWLVGLRNYTGTGS